MNYLDEEPSIYGYSKYNGPFKTKVIHFLWNGQVSRWAYAVHNKVNS